MRGKQSGIAFGQRNQKGQSDTTLLIQIANYLRERWHMDFKREWYVGFNRETGGIERISESVDKRECEGFKWRNPDLLYLDRRRGLIIIEVDGAVHDRRVAKTEERNEEFRQANAHLIIINLREIKNNKTSIEDDIDCKMTKLFSEQHTGTQ